MIKKEKVISKIDSSRETIGKMHSDFLDSIDYPVEILDFTNEYLKIYEKGLEDAANSGSKDYPTGDFYIWVTPTVDKFIKGLPRIKFAISDYAPSPVYNQDLFRYSYATGTLELIWVVPDKETCKEFKNDPLGVDSSHKEMLGYVLDFYDGTLFKKFIGLNKGNKNV
jgi:hypothetical protein